MQKIKEVIRVLSKSVISVKLNPSAKDF